MSKKRRVTKDESKVQMLHEEDDHESTKKQKVDNKNVKTILSYFGTTNKNTDTEQISILSSSTTDNQAQSNLVVGTTERSEPELAEIFLTQQQKLDRQKKRKEQAEKDVIAKEKEIVAHLNEGKAPHPFFLPGSNSHTSAVTQSDTSNLWREVACPTFPVISHVTQSNDPPITCQPHTVNSLLCAPKVTKTKLPPFKHYFNTEVPPMVTQNTMTLQQYFKQLFDIASPESIKTLYEQCLPKSSDREALWTEKYKPLIHNDLIGNTSHVTYLSQWLTNWKASAQQTTKPKSKARQIIKASKLINTIVINGPSGIIILKYVIFFRYWKNNIYLYLCK
jgi:hypothetical protein